MKYSQETYEVIRKRMLDNMSNTIDKREGSFVSNMVSPVGVEFAKYYIELDNILSIMFLEDATNEFLDKKVYDFGVYRKEGTKAHGLVQIQGQKGTRIPRGTKLLSESSLEFITLEDAWIEEDVLEVFVESVDIGLAYNIIANSKFKLEPTISGVGEITNKEGFIEGTDRETDEELRERFFEIIRRPATSGNIYHYEQWAKEIDGINQAKIKPLWNGAGTVKVIVSNNNEAVSPDIVQKCKEHIDAVRPIGAEVTVITPELIDLTITANIYVEEGYSSTAAKLEFEENLASYLLGCDGTIVYTRIASCLGSTTGITDYTELKVNGLTANISYDDEKLPFIKSIVLSEVV